MKIPEIISRIPKGAVLVMHASFKACKDEGISPEEMLQMLMAQLGEEGTLMLPTFTYKYADIWAVKPYHTQPPNRLLTFNSPSPVGASSERNIWAKLFRKALLFFPG